MKNLLDSPSTIFYYSGEDFLVLTIREIRIPDDMTDSDVSQAMQAIADLANGIASKYLQGSKRRAADPAVQSIMTIAMHAEGVAKFLEGQTKPTILAPQMVMGQRPS